MLNFLHSMQRVIRSKEQQMRWAGARNDLLFVLMSPKRRVRAAHRRVARTKPTSRQREAVQPSLWVQHRSL
jgi:hypothetical protein